MNPPLPDPTAADAARLGGPAQVAIFGVALLLRLAALLSALQLEEVRTPYGDGDLAVRDALRFLQHDWVLARPFYAGPGYSHVLALVMAVAGSNAFVLRLFQIAADALTAVLLGRLGARLGGRAAGVIAGLLFALYGPAFFYDSVVLKTAYELFALTVTTVLVVESSGSIASCAVIGLALGATAWFRETALLFVVPIALYLLPRLRTRGPALAALALGMLAAIAPATLHNRLAGEWVLLSSSGGQNLYLGNNPETPMEVDFPALSFMSGDVALEEAEFAAKAGAALGVPQPTARQVSDYFRAQAFAAIRAAPIAFVRRVARKANAALANVEVPDTLEEEWLRLQLPFFAAPWPHFALLLALAAVGVVAWWPRRERTGALLLALGLLHLASLTLFFVLGRFRHDLVLTLVPFAGVGVASVPALLRSKRQALLGAGAALFAGAGSRGALPPHFPVISYTNDAVRALQHDDLDRAERSAQAVLARLPDQPDNLLALAEVAARRGRPEEALAHYQRAAAAATPSPEIVAAYAEALRAHGDRAEARVQAERALKLAPNNASARRVLAALDAQEKLSP